MDNSLGHEMAAARQPVLFYDGECGFCNGSVAFVLKHEREHSLMFAPLQGETAAAALKDSGLPPGIGAKSIVLHEDDQFFVRSRAAMRTMRHMGGGWKLLASLLGLVPAPLADVGYRLVAANRQRIPFKKSCELLPPEQRKRFLP